MVYCTVLFDESISHFILRFLGCLVHTSGTTWVYVIGSFVVSWIAEYLDQAEPLWKLVEQRMRRQRVKLYVLCAALSLLILYCVAATVTRRPAYSSQEIAAYTTGLVVGISTNYPDMEPSSMEPPESSLIGTGFWIDDRGWVVTCSHRFRAGIPGKSPVGVISFEAPSLTENLWGFTIVGPSVTASGAFIYFDQDSGMTLYRVRLNPWDRAREGKLHLPIEIKVRNPRTGEVKTVAEEQYHTSAVSSARPEVGDTIYVAGVDANEPTGASIWSGTVTRVSPNVSSSSHYIRLYTSIPMRPTYWGAPVLNSSEELVGIVSDESKSEVVAISAEYLPDLQDKINHFEPFIITNR